MRGFRRVLGLCPVLIAVLWLAGFARFRGIVLTTTDWLLVTAAVLALQTIGRRVARPRPLPPLPANTNPATMAALAAALATIPAALLGGGLEWIFDGDQPSDISWAMRTLWHAASAFAICYCGFLLQLTQAPRPPAGSPPTA